MKYENQTKQHLVELILKQGESGKNALAYILYNSESKRLERIYTRANLEPGIMHLEFEDAVGNFYLYMWNGKYFEKLQDPEALGAWIGRIFYRFLLHDWQTIKKLERAIQISHEERIDYKPSEQIELALHKTALTLALINQTQIPERRYAFFRNLLKGYLRQERKKIPADELTDRDVVFVMKIREDRYRQWRKRVKDEVQAMVKTMKVDQLVCQLNAESLALAERICNGGQESIIDWLKELIDMTEECLDCCEEIRRFRKDLQTGKRNHVVPMPPSTASNSLPPSTIAPGVKFSLNDKIFEVELEECGNSQLVHINGLNPERKPRIMAEPKQEPEKRGYMSVLERMLGI